MAMETINAIREAETQAEQKILQAQEKASQIVAQAEKRAEQLLFDCKKKCAQDIKLAEREEEANALRKSEEAVNEAQKEVGELKKSVALKQAEAKAAILKEMFSVQLEN